MSRDQFDNPPVHTLGPNGQHHALWDLQPDDGGSPRKFVKPAIDAKEFVDRDPERYCFAHPEETSPPTRDGDVT